MDHFDGFLFMILQSRKYMNKIYTDWFLNQRSDFNSAVCIRIINNSEDGISASGICDACGFDKAQVSRILRELADCGYIRRNPQDDGLKRGYRYVLTEKGEEGIAEMNKDVERLTAYFVEDIPAEHTEIFYDVLMKISDRVKLAANNGLCGSLFDLDIDHRRNEEENA